jgi:hypothetical protein
MIYLPAAVVAAAVLQLCSGIASLDPMISLPAAVVAAAVLQL